MSDNRTDGYITDIAYITNCYVEHAPSWLNYIAVLNGVPPRSLEAGFTYIDLGCGFGETVNVAAAAYPQGRFYGMDFNPVHIATARDRAATWEAGNVTFLAESFQNLSRMDLPDFDFVVLHGIYSWVSEEARQAIQDFLRSRLKPGGIVHVSYNCMPGWAEVAPVQKLLFELGEAAGGDSLGRLASAIPQLERLSDLASGYLSQSGVRRRVQGLSSLDRSYAAHEYLNANWRPRYSCDVASEMRLLGLTYVGLGLPVENHLGLMLTEAAAALVSSQPNDGLKQLVADFAINRAFRRDIYIKAQGKLCEEERLRNLGMTCFAHPGDLGNIERPVKIPRGTFRIEDELARELMLLFSRGSLSMGDVLAQIPGSLADPREVEEAVTSLVAGTCLMPAARAHRIAGVSASERLGIPLAANRQVIADVVSAARGGLDGFLAHRAVLVSPVAGNGLTIDGIDALVLHHRSERAREEPDLLQAVCRSLSMNGHEDGMASAPSVDVDAVRRAVDAVQGTLIPSLERLGILQPG